MNRSLRHCLREQSTEGLKGPKHTRLCLLLRERQEASSVSKVGIEEVSAGGLPRHPLRGAVHPSRSSCAPLPLEHFYIAFTTTRRIKYYSASLIIYFPSSSIGM